MAARSALAAACAALLVLAAAHASAEAAWVREGTRLSLREGAGNDRAVLGTVGAGERLEVIGTLSGWSQVRRSDGTQGWLADAVLVREPPASARVAALEADVARLSDALAAAERENAALRGRTERMPPAGAPPPSPSAAPPPRGDSRWLDYLVGALILSTGMALGAMLRGVSGRRRSTRLRL